MAAADYSGMAWVPSSTVAALSANATAGAIAFATNGRAYVVSGLGALSLQASGSGTGVLVTYNGTAWTVVGTTTVVSA